MFHWLLLVVCGWANASDAVEILCVSFLLPTARCDLLLSSSDMGLLTASIFLGESQSFAQSVTISDLWLIDRKLICIYFDNGFCNFSNINAKYSLYIPTYYQYIICSCMNIIFCLYSLSYSKFNIFVLECSLNKTSKLKTSP